MNNSATASEGKFAYLLLKKPPNMYFPILMRRSCWLSQIQIPIAWYLPFEAPEGDHPVGVLQRGRAEQNSLQSLSCVQQMTPRRWWDGICDLDSKLGCSSLLECCLSLPDPSCILPNKYFSSLHSSDYALHWIQIKRQNVSLISTVMWDR